MMQTVSAILEPLLVQYDEIDVGEARESFATETRSRPDTGPLLLMRAVLRDAILCLQGEAPHVPKRCRARIASEARSWILSRDPSYAFSFEAICDVLGLHAASLRQHLLRLFPAASRPGEPQEAGGRDMIRLLRRSRMRGNFRTRVVAKRRRRGRRTLERASGSDRTPSLEAAAVAI